ncbi:MAG: type IV secretion system DNA-binding domain-containing protein [Chloroflexi bacterium]|nr:type IV secretion system DNA-binding domain-containing protein [Chloroflexota bacterium]
MLKNLLTGMFKGKPKPATRLWTITPQRSGERTLLAVENFLASVSVAEPFSLELVGDDAGVSILARCREGAFVRQQLGVYYPQARVSPVTPEDDPLRLAEGERAWSMTIRIKGPEYLPLRPFHDDDLLDPGSDPMLAIIGSLSDLEEGERVVAQIRLLTLGADWTRQHQEKARRQSKPEPALSADTGRAQVHTKDGVTMAILGVAALVGLRGYFWVQAGETWKAVLLGAGAATALVVAGWAWWRIRKALSGGKHHDPLMIQEKVSRMAYQAQVEAFAILPEHAGQDRAQKLLDSVAAGYANYNNLAGASFRACKIKPIIPETEPMPPATRLFQARGVLGVRELATLWHPLGPGDQLPMVRRAGARVLPPPAINVGGAHVGDTVDGKPRPVRFSPDTYRRHHLYVARTGMGKSTLMQHVVEHRMAEKAAGRDHDAIIVVDPHADMVTDILKRVPAEIIDQTYLIDLADEERVPGINLLDAHVFPDRDRTCDSVVRIAKGLWDQWGPRMQSILEHTVKSLHEYNSHPDTEEDEQLTILDGLRMLADLEFRRDVLRRVDDPYVAAWWLRELPGWARETRSQALAPVQTRLAYYASSKKARAILGQPRSTIDLRRVISDGGVLLVAASQSAAGRDVSALVGASLLNLVGAVIAEQGNLPPDQRRGALVVVDEMQAIPGVDYESMLSELGKFGANFILATQSLARLAELSNTMRDTLLANVGCLAVFQVAAADARDIMGELDRERVAEEDLVSLPSHHCYVRATHEGERQPTYTMMVRKPRPSYPEVEELVRARTVEYTAPIGAVIALEDEAREQVQKLRERMERQQGNQSDPAGENGGKQSGNGQTGTGQSSELQPGNEPPSNDGDGQHGRTVKKPRSRHRRRDEAAPGQAPTDGS